MPSHADAAAPPRRRGAHAALTQDRAVANASRTSRSAAGLIPETIMAALSKAAAHVRIQQQKVTS
jgi:hypothetical protein